MTNIKFKQLKRKKYLQERKVGRIVRLTIMFLKKIANYKVYFDIHSGHWEEEKIKQIVVERPRGQGRSED